MAPLVRRGWALKGCTPLFYQKTRSHHKASVIAALVVSPARRSVRLFFRIHRDRNINTALTIDFLRHLLRQLRSPLFLIWDRWTPHRAKKTNVFLQRISRLHCAFLPAYAPELNPVEYVWSWTKGGALANFAPTSIDELTRAAFSASRRAQRKEPLLRSFLRHSPLSLRLH